MWQVFISHYSSLEAETHNTSEGHIFMPVTKNHFTGEDGQGCATQQRENPAHFDG